MSCTYCDIIKGNKHGAVVYEDEKIISFLSEQPATIGHLIVLPKRHVPIFEELTDSEVSHLFTVANKLSIAVFESVKTEGTNVIVYNGVGAGQDEPHISVNIIARKSGDGIFLEWTPRQLGESEMAAIELRLKNEIEESSAVTHEETAPKEASEEAKNAEPSEPLEKDTTKRDYLKQKEESYLIKQLRRVP
jgi:histidine triad (HIT) family protein